MKSNKEIRIKKKEFRTEHKHIVKVLKRGTATQRKKEAKKQAKELKAL